MPASTELVPDARVVFASVLKMMPPAVCISVPDGITTACGAIGAPLTGIEVAKVTSPVAATDADGLMLNNDKAPSTSDWNASA